MAGMDSKHLAGKVALVTGGGRGIGRAICIELARAGAAVVPVARTRAQIEEVADEIRRGGGTSLAVAADATNDADIHASVETVQRELGRIDILVNNAGDNILGKFAEQPPDEWWQQIVIGLRAPYLYSRLVLPGMRQRNWGRIINMSSVNGKKGAMFCSAYCTAKHGIIGLTRALAVELGKTNITVNAVCPGWVGTDLTERTMAQRTQLLGMTQEQIEQLSFQGIPQRVIMTPEEVAPSVAFLASEQAARITGEALNVSAGAVMH